jgi:hypothetical protein
VLPPPEHATNTDNKIEPEKRASLIGYLRM